MRVKVNTEECIGCGLCVSVCPRVFSMTEAEKAVAIPSPLPEREIPAAEEALAGCPVNAIEAEIKADEKG